MVYHRYVSFIAIAGLFSFLGWLLIIFRLSPFEIAGLSLSLFFLTLFSTFVSLFTVVGFYFRVWMFKNEIFYKHINVSLRQGVILSLLTVLALVLQMLRVLSWFSGFFLVAIAVVLEFYFSTRDSEELE